MKLKIREMDDDVCEVYLTDCGPHGGLCDGAIYLKSSHAGFTKFELQITKAGVISLISGGNFVHGERVI